MKAVAGDRRDSREQISVGECLLIVENGAHADRRPASPVIGDEAVPHLVVEKEKIIGVRLGYLSDNAPFLNDSCRFGSPLYGWGRADLYEN